MYDFMDLFFIECSYFHIRNNLKTFQNFDYPLLYAQQVVIIFPACFGAHVHTLLALLPRANRQDWHWPQWADETKTGDNIRLFTFIFNVDAERTNKLKRFPYYYIFSLNFENDVGV